ncbi:MAG TPA: hypothetical protein VGM56_30540, partial [Byssovorax sp.]
GERLDVSFPERGITVGRFILAPVTGITIARFDEGGLGGTVGAGIPIGARFGILQDLEVRATAVPLVFAPHAGYGGLPDTEGLIGPSFGATFRFLRGFFEMGAAADFTIRTGTGESGFLFDPGVPMRLHLGRIAALDTGLFFPISNIGVAATGPGFKVSASETTGGMEIPLRFSFDAVPPRVHLLVESGVKIEDFGNAGDTFAIPLGFGGGFALPGRHGPIFDLDPFFRWPEFLTPGAQAVGAGRAKVGGDKVNAGDFETGLEFTFYLYL